MYGDTDSIFVILNDGPYEIQKMINFQIKSYLDKFFNLNKNIVYLEYEKKFNKFILLEKKRYCGIMTYMDGKEINRIFYRGLEVIQKSTIEYTRKKIEEVLKYIMIENVSKDFIKNCLYLAP